jgi:hypothetical protein
MIKPPPSVLGTFHPPNYVNPVTQNLALPVMSIICLALSTFCVGVRLYGRMFVRRFVGLDDFFVFVAWVRAHFPLPLDII